MSSRHNRSQRLRQPVALIAPALGGHDAVPSVTVSIDGVTRSRHLPYFRPLDQPTLRDAIATAEAVADQFYLVHIVNAPNAAQLVLSVRVPGAFGAKYRITAQSFVTAGKPPKILLADR